MRKIEINSVGFPQSCSLLQISIEKARDEKRWRINYNAESPAPGIAARGGRRTDEPETKE